MSAEALRQLLHEVKGKPADAPVTWGELAEAIAQAESWISTLEYERYMGDDL